MSQKIEVEHNGRKFWYYQEHEKALAKFRKERETACRLHWNKKSCDIAMDEDKQEKYPHANSLVERMIPIQNELNDLHYRMNLKVAAMDNNKKYPLLPDQAFKVPETFPPPGKIYETGKMNYLSRYPNSSAINNMDELPNYTSRSFFINMGETEAKEIMDSYNRTGIFMFNSDDKYNKPVYGKYPRRMLLLL